MSAADEIRYIPARESLEAYISQAGNICLKADDNPEMIISIDFRDVPKVIEWLEALYDERSQCSDDEFNQSLPLDT